MPKSNSHRFLSALLLVLAAAACGVPEEAFDDSMVDEAMLAEADSVTQVFAGSLSATGTAWASHDVSYASAGTLEATLDWGTASADFSLFLSDVSDSSTLASSTGAAKPERINLHLPAGSYRLGVKAKTGSSSYTLTAKFTPDSLQFLSTGSVSQARAWKSHSFPASAGDKIRVTLDWGSSADLNAFLYAPSGSLLKGTAGSTARPEVVEATATESGTWKVGVKAFSGSASYTVTVRVTPSVGGVDPVPEPPPPAPGCVARFAGDPGCASKIYYGASVEGGAPKTFETQLGTTLSVYRSYFKPDDTPASFANRANDDLANRRLPLMSTKVPNNDWAGVGAGKYDTWLLPIIKALAAVPGPVWLSLHHEPRSDGAPADWVKMQQRARQLIDANSKNIALVGILNGFSFLQKVPDADEYNHPVGSGVHVMGFDSYCQWSPTAGGTWREPNVVFSPGVSIAGWGYPTLVGEYGVRTDPANPGKAAQWLKDAWSFASSNKFVAISYFNSGANSPDGTWELEGERLTAFKSILAKPEVARP
jgi:hypothetical protein